MVLIASLLSSWVADDRAGHAVAPAASAPELLAGDGEHLHPRLGELAVGGLVALVADHDAGFESDDVAVVTLVALGLEFVAARRAISRVCDAERVLELVEERPARRSPPPRRRPPGRNRIGRIWSTTGS